MEAPDCQNFSAEARFAAFAENFEYITTENAKAPHLYMRKAMGRAMRGMLLKSHGKVYGEGIPLALMS